jgi:hypothetical protein
MRPEQQIQRFRAPQQAAMMGEATRLEDIAAQLMDAAAGTIPAASFTWPPR